MVILDIIVKSLTILALITFMIIAIWGFVVFNSICNQLKYSNYILEKISHILNISTTELEYKQHHKKNAASEAAEATVSEDAPADAEDSEADKKENTEEK